MKTIDKPKYKNKISKIRELHRRCAKIGTIARECKIHPTTMRVILYELGLFKLCTKKEMQQIEKFYKEGLRNLEISKRLGIDAFYIGAVVNGLTCIPKRKSYFLGKEAELIKEMYVTDKMLCTDIAKEFNTYTPKIIMTLQIMGVDVTTHPLMKYTYEEINKFVHAYTQGYSSCDVAKHCDVSAGYVIALVRKAGKVVRNERKKVVMPSKEQLSKDRQTMSLRAIGDKYNVSRTTAWNWVRKYEL